VILFWTVLGLLLLERSFELGLSRRNERRLLARGGRRVLPDGFWGLAFVHGALFPAMVVESGLAPWAGVHGATWPLLGAALATMALRYWAVASLGERWCTRVVVVPGAPLVAHGPYRFAKHPNYVAASLELFVVPAAFGLWATAVGAAVANLVALRVRMRVEQAALSAASA